MLPRLLPALALAVLMTLFTGLPSSFVAARPVSSNRMLDLVNNVRNQHGLRPLHLLGSLNADAKDHSLYQADINSVTHDDNRGGGADRLVREYGLQPQYWAENVALNHGGEEGAFETWMNSPGHRANILNPQATHMGIGDVDGYWTQVFAKI
ncbi:hypothetical protein H4R33_007008 [Dimargaris cristalligena]|uniref:SCP domain-containing protein n=1 Tax=Dimargaris cristalligena TaxID=215637 RepID=A0A4P9ZLF4_9FUNG|nr:hypothetical protein H4R33_007008 [Dimargaris cristalligena]RKP33412.1 hypothetical protein BJ085DRAFT_40249 [Dimargaris cristalligena]|eukprot:RKP33412.1 hypothetical protein BJ085DRAFT_40249 [Dimargaris cristalligena]